MTWQEWGNVVRAAAADSGRAERLVRDGAFWRAGGDVEGLLAGFRTRELRQRPAVLRPMPLSWRLRGALR